MQLFIYWYHLTNRLIRATIYSNYVILQEQYIVLHETLLEALYFQNTSMSKEDFTKLMTENNDERIEKEFKVALFLQIFYGTF